MRGAHRVSLEDRMGASGSASSFDTRIERVLARLRERFGASAFTRVEHWDSDLCAVGIAHADAPARMVYISTCNCADGRYDVALETAPATADGAPTRDGHFTAVDFETLAALVAKHLALTAARDRVEQASLESFPASDAPSWGPLHPGRPGEHPE
jgi:hypothetical protein